MGKRLLHLLVAGTLVLGAACGGDDDPGADTEAPSDDGSSGERDTGEEGAGGQASDNADVEAFCAHAEALAADLEASDGDPASVTGLVPQVTDLQQAAAALSANADDLDEADVERFNECAASLNDAAASLSGS